MKKEMLNKILEEIKQIKKDLNNNHIEMRNELDTKIKRCEKFTNIGVFELRNYMDEEFLQIEEKLLKSGRIEDLVKRINENVISIKYK